MNLRLTNKLELFVFFKNYYRLIGLINNEKLKDERNSLFLFKIFSLHVYSCKKNFTKSQVFSKNINTNTAIDIWVNKAVLYMLFKHTL